MGFPIEACGLGGGAFEAVVPDVGPYGSNGCGFGGTKVVGTSPVVYCCSDTSPCCVGYCFGTGSPAAAVLDVVADTELDVVSEDVTVDADADKDGSSAGTIALGGVGSAGDLSDEAGVDILLV